MQPTASAIEDAFNCYQQGDLDSAEAILAKLAEHPSALHLIGIIRVRQGRLTEAVEFLSRSVTMRPGEAQAQLNLGKVCHALGRNAEASRALQAALDIAPDLSDAALLLGKSLQAEKRTSDAIKAYRLVIAKQPHHASAILLLANALVETGDPQAAKDLLMAATANISDARLLANLHQGLAALLKGTLPAEALVHLEKAQSFDPLLTNLDFDRALLLEELHRFHDARAAYERILARNPVDAAAHHGYNDLLYRLDSEDFLASYDNAPRRQELMLAKAEFLLLAGQSEKAEDCFRDALARYSDSKQAMLGLGLSQIKGGKLKDAAGTFERATMLYPKSVDTYCNLAGALVQLGDPQKANAISKQALGIDPQNQVALAMLGTSLRLLDDPSDERLTGYDEFIQVFDLAPPEGYPDMETFNRELSAQLEAMHPPVREYLRQSLRGGTQTRDNIFEKGNTLVGKLQSRIREAVARYIDNLREDDRHPYLSRKRSGFRFAGSWSSLLHDQGFHINHLHPGGWISSCYYVDLPEVVNDKANHQGWIKFGQPSFEVGLPARCAIQPAVGRLVLFPSYMWHGTIPFHSSHARTTIAFDVLPHCQE